MGSTVAPGQTAAERAVTMLRSAILEGSLEPGQKINQETWAERAGVSLIPIREALGTLAGEGLVTYRPRRGFSVTELDLADLEEVYRLRALLETDALTRGVPYATPADVARLRTAADECELAGSRGDIAGQLAANRRFHGTLHALSGSQRLTRLIEHLWDATEAYRALYYAVPGEAERAHEAHGELLDAVALRDVPRAVRVQDAHRTRALEALRGTLTSRSG